MVEEITREEAIEFIKDLRSVKSRQARAFKDRGYTGDYSDCEGCDQYGFEYEGVYWNCWHEASDPTGAVKALKTLFDISEDELNE